MKSKVPFSIDRKTYIFNNVLLFDIKLFNDDISEFKRAKGPSENNTIVLKKNSVCRSIINDNNNPQACKDSHQYVN